MCCKKIVPIGTSNYISPEVLMDNSENGYSFLMTMLNIRLVLRRKLGYDKSAIYIVSTSKRG